mmetsp:Transcript_39870/g.29420  ORF Transcript_39870/g.29420 Transcript_39870/m.29420 type:complete len:142 (-) Transcript_39870:248-673(-)
MVDQSSTMEEAKEGVPIEKQNFQKVRQALRREMQKKAWSILAEYQEAVKSGKAFTAKDVLEKHIVVHKNIPCHVCGMKSIIGVRFKCISYQDTNMCETCEEQDKSGQTVIKFPTAETGGIPQYYSEWPLTSFTNLEFTKAA